MTSPPPPEYVSLLFLLLLVMVAGGRFLFHVDEPGYTCGICGAKRKDGHAKGCPWA